MGWILAPVFVCPANDWSRKPWHSALLTHREQDGPVFIFHLRQALFAPIWVGNVWQVGECIYHRQWNTPINPIKTPAFAVPGPASPPQPERLIPTTTKHEDKAKLLFGVVYSLRNMTRKLSTPCAKPLEPRLRGANRYCREDNFISYRTSNYKLHYYETPTQLKFVMTTDAKTENKRIVLHQIYVGLYVEFIVKNPLREVDGPVDVETFNLALDQFVRTLVYRTHTYIRGLEHYSLMSRDFSWSFFFGAMMGDSGSHQHTFVP